MVKIENREINQYKSKLKQMRVASGFTQNELSQLSGINVKSIASYEQDTDKIINASVKTLYLLSECLNCSIEDLIDTNFIK